jgi:hypothetical protein
MVLQKALPLSFFLSHPEICLIPKDRTVTYARIMIDHRPQKEDPKRV